MDNFLVRLLVVIGMVWLIQFLLSTFNIQEPPRNLILVVSVILLLLWLIFGYTYLPMH